MAKIIITTLLTFLATPSLAYAQDYNSYQEVEARAEAENMRISQSIDMENMQNHMSQVQQPVYQQPQVEYQSETRDTMYGTMYVGPGSGYGR